MFFSFFRFLVAKKVRVGSYAKERKFHAKMHGKNWTVEKATFTKKDKIKDKIKTHQAAWSYVLDLKQHIFDRLDDMKK